MNPLKILNQNKFWNTLIIIVIGSLIFKYLPMYIWGSDILFDASNHIMTTSLGLYFIYILFIDKKANLQIPYFIFSGIVLILMGHQRIYANQHNLIGLALGLIIAAIAIFYPRKELKKRKNRK